MKAYKACCLCGKEGHRSNACPLGKYRQIDDETARQLARAIHEVDLSSVILGEFPELGKADRDALVEHFNQLRDECAPSGSLH